MKTKEIEMSIKEELQKLLEKELENEKIRHEKACTDETKAVKEKTDSENRIKALELLLNKHEHGEKLKQKADLLSASSIGSSMKFKNKTVAEAAFEVLEEASYPMSTVEIWEKLKEGGKNVVKPAVGVTLRNDKNFKLVGRGVFALSNEKKESAEAVE